MTIVDKVDHPVIGVHDLEAARSAFARLGFVVPPAGKHEEWGTTNVCIMFPNDYLEIRGIADATRFLAGLDKFLEKGEGFSGVAFSTANATDSYQKCVEHGLEAHPPKELNRKLALSDKTLSLKFRTMALAPELHPGLTHANLCEHLTPDVLRQPGWVDHPNGALGFRKLVGVVEDHDSAYVNYSRLLGADRVHRFDKRLLLDFGRGAIIELIDPSEASQRGEAQPARDPAYLASATIQVKSASRLTDLFLENGIGFETNGKRVSIDPYDAAGARLHFEEK
ncbi:VOC family protein [Paraburkholderia caledonica]|uniref:Glyoxalase-like domain-containing protein n=1 Tax=Paraburkholderia caledonica TaxID=134536 RepID=A0AB73IMT8_9BURK|nr:hypothetical protein [Paraburkholderia caledonica]